MVRPKHPTKTRHVRLPVEIDRQIEKRAEQNDRTFNGEIVALLREALRVKEPAPSGDG